MKLAPSILSADYSRLADEVGRVAAEADFLHIDVVDGHFAHNLTVGPVVVEALRRRTDLFLDCHLMVTNPATLLSAFAEAGADNCTIHVEVGDPDPVLERIHGLGMRAGLAHNPETPLDAVVPHLERVNLVNTLSVHPGFGGQAFIPAVLDKLVELRRIVDDRRLAIDLEIDGGINASTAPRAAVAGAHILVAGSAIFRAEDAALAARQIRDAAASAS
jgi:ribulose-phosphate 3-epimerase